MLAHLAESISLNLKNADNIIHPLRLSEKTILELESNLVLCDTGIKHDSGAIHADQKSSLTNNNDISELVKLNVQNTYDIKKHATSRAVKWFW